MAQKIRVRIPATPLHTEVAQLVRAGILYIQGQGFKALLPYHFTLRFLSKAAYSRVGFYVSLDKLVKSPVCKTVIIGSNPIGDSIRGGGVNPFLG